MITCTHTANAVAIRNMCAHDDHFVKIILETLERGGVFPKEKKFHCLVIITWPLIQLYAVLL